MPLSLRVMAKTALNCVMKLDNGDTIACVSCLVYVVLADNTCIAEIPTDPEWIDRKGSWI